MITTSKFIVITTRDKTDKWLIFHGCFDSYFEELMRLSNLDNYNILVFEGPGKWRSNKNGLPMTPSWKEPVSALLIFLA